MEGRGEGRGRRQGGQTMQHVAGAHSSGFQGLFDGVTDEGE